MLAPLRNDRGENFGWPSLELVAGEGTEGSVIRRGEVQVTETWPLGCQPRSYPDLYLLYLGCHVTFTPQHMSFPFSTMCYLHRVPVNRNIKGN